ncbi:MAG: glycosyltransferase family 39 protein [Planctomycetes bacterium]|nr:glycosyltransferase family 39 protein [Planctomycetota bacterium]
MQQEAAKPPGRNWWLPVLIIAPYLAFLGTLPLMEPDEGRYSEIPREMLESGDWVTPRLNYVKYFEKPALHYWLTALAMKAFGRNEFAARFFPMLFSLLTVGAVYLLAGKLYGKRAATISALVLAGSLFWFIMGRVNIIDPVVSSLIAMSLVSFLMWDLEEDRKKKLLYLFGYYALAALATLAKGLIGILFPGGIVFWYIVGTRRFRIFRDMGLWWGIPLYLLIAAPWFIAVSLRNPDFAAFFFIHEHVDRFLTKVHKRDEPLYYFIPIMTGGLLPFTGYLIPAVIEPVRRIWKTKVREAQPEFFLILWMLLVFAFFSVSNSKLPPYILPVFPAAAVLTGGYIDRREREWDASGFLPRAHWWGMGALILMLFIPVIGALIQEDYPVARALPYAILPAALVAAAVVSAIVAGRRSAHGVTPYLHLAMVGLVLGLLPAIRDMILPFKAERPVSRALEQLAAPDEPIVGLYHYKQSVPFYTGRRMVVVEHMGELEFGYSRAPDREEWLWTTDRFLEEWRSGRRLWVIAADKTLERSRGVDGPTTGDLLGEYHLVERSGYMNLITNLPVDMHR